MQDCFDRTVARCDAILARHTAMMRRMSPDTAVFSLAQTMMETLQRTKDIAVLSQQRRRQSLIRSLRLQVIHQYIRRGQIIAMAIRQIDADLLSDALANPDEAAQCLELYRNRRDFHAAHCWQSATGGATPATLTDALMLLRRWQQRGRPCVGEPLRTIH